VLLCVGVGGLSCLGLLARKVRSNFTLIQNQIQSAAMSELGKVELFSGLLAEGMQSLEQTAEMRAYKPRDVIFQEGDPGDGIYVVVEGEVRVSTLVSETERRVLTSVEPGDFFGEMAILDDRPRSATAQAELDTKVYFLHRDDLLKLLEHSPKLAVCLLREFSLRLRDFNKKYVEESLQAERLTLVGRFARSIVHDFKNPLNIIGLAAEIAGMESASAELRQSAQQRIGKQVTRLSNMINELLEFTRGSQASIVLAPVKYSPYVETIIEDLRSDLTDKAVELEVGEVPDVSTMIDQRRVVHVFYNLINNAVDVLSDGGKIYVRFSVKDGFVITEIEDTGEGIAPEIINKVFEPFATHGKAQGTGLGLAICKKIVEDHKGFIEARNSEAGGAIFSFRLPICA
jgi:signal transduction histidine kinase